MKKFSCLFGVLVLFISFNSAAFYIADEESLEEQSSLFEYIWSSLSYFKFDGIIDFGGAIPDLSSVFSIRREPYTPEEIERLGL